jgi:asparagine synthase (glutamine-hydrolysing)
VIAAHDEPVHSMAVVIAYHLMKLARAHGIPVVLNGNGSDEVLAGYDSFFKLHWESVLRRDGPRAAYRHIKAFSKVHGGEPRPRFLNLLRSTVTTEMRRIPPYRWAAARFGSGHETDPWFSRELYTVLPDEHPGVASDPLNTWLTGSVNEFPLPLYLREEDRSCMAHSVEGRLPFMDYRLVSLISPLPGAVKMSGPWNKIILREAIRGRVPESVRSRAVKWGFAIPAADWVKGELHEPLRDMLESRETRERGIYNTGLILKDLERHCRGEIDVATRMIRVAQFEMWCRQVGIR